MPAFTPTRASVEDHIAHLQHALALGAANVPLLDELSAAEYAEAVSRTEYWRYVQAADYHYFISRVLFVRHITEYSFFAGHQCIENYLKGYLKWRDILPPNSHKLSALVDNVRAAAPFEDAFIHEYRLAIIASKYEPFYELARYPVQRRRPKGGYGFIIPDDIYVLDYFVLRMRELLAIPPNTWDILSDGHFSLHLCQEQFPDFYALFVENNINFAKT